MAQTNLDFLSYQKELNEFFADSTHESLLKHFFKFVRLNLAKLNDKALMADTLPSLHHLLRLELQNGTRAHIGAFISSLLSDDSDETILSSLRILYQILQTLEPEDTEQLQIGDEIFQPLIQLLFNNRAKAEVLDCLKVYVNKFSKKAFIEQLWCDLVKPKLGSVQLATEDNNTLQILVHFFDEFAAYVDEFKYFEQLTPLIHDLLCNKTYENRKKACVLLNKVYNYRIQKAEKADAETLKLFWSVCIRIFESLEERSSDTLLLNLAKLKNVHIVNFDDRKWLDLLHRLVLRHNNVKAKRWMLEHLLERFTYVEMSHETQQQLLLVLNDNALYNFEGYMLPVCNIRRFLVCDRAKFFDTFSSIVWKAASLHFWLTQLIECWNAVNSSDIFRGVLMRLASKIRALQNSKLRKTNISLFQKLFHINIANMSLCQYMELIETLYNITDNFAEFKILSEKIERCPDEELDGNLICSQRCYDILTHAMMKDKIQRWKDGDLLKDQISTAKCSETAVLKLIEQQRNALRCANFSDVIAAPLLKKLDRVPTKHGFLRFLIVFDLKDTVEQRNFCQRHYKLHMRLMHGIDLNNMYDTFVKSLAEDEAKERDFIGKKVTDFFVQFCLRDYRSLKTYQLRLDVLLETGSSLTLFRLSHLLALCKDDVGTHDLTCFIERLKPELKDEFICSSVVRNLMIYCCQKFDSNKYSKWLEYILQLDLENEFLASTVLVDSRNSHLNINLLIKGALIGEANIGDARIEEAYACKILKESAKFYTIRNSYLHYIAHLADETTKSDIITGLVRNNDECNLKKPVYSINSKEHCLKLRIAHVMERLRFTRIAAESLEPIWKLLTEQNNLSNVSLVYERVAGSLPIETEILIRRIEKELQNTQSTSNQVISMLSVLYHHISSKEADCKVMDQLTRMLRLLRSYITAGSVQLYAQFVMMSVLELIPKHDEIYKHSHLLPCELEAIEELKKDLHRTNSAKKFEDLCDDIRFKKMNEKTFSSIMFATNAPYDEYDLTFNVDEWKTLRTNYAKTLEIELNSNEKTGEPTPLDAQQELNPSSDLSSPPVVKLDSDPETSEREVCN